MTVKLFVDGGVIGKNPSTEGVYWSVGQDMPDGTHRVLTDRATSREYFTNNEAEYLALLDALNRAAATAAPGWRVIIHSDSQLIVNQFNGKWGCHEERLRPLLKSAQQAAEWLASQGIEVEVVWVRRKENVKRLGH